MNKSKFLKRSLATLLAVLMVVAMVPMSAFAADPDVIKIGGSVAKLDGTTYTVSFDVPNGTSGVIEKALENVTFELQSTTGTTVAVLGKDGKPIDTSLMGRPGTTSATKTVNIIARATKPEGDGVYFGNYTDMKLRVTEKGKAPVSYNLVITVNERNADNRVTIEDVVSTRIVDAIVDDDAGIITIVKPVGANSKRDTLGLTKECFKQASKDASVTLTENNNIVTAVTVTAEDKSTKKYSIEYVVEKIFDSFTVSGMIGEVTEEEYIDETNPAAPEATGNVIVTVNVPYNTYTIKPTFTAASAIMEMYALDFSPVLDQNPRNMNNVPDTSVGGNPLEYGIYHRVNGQSTSGEATWVKSPADANTKDQYENMSESKGQASTTFTMKVRSNISSQYDQSDLSNAGQVFVKIVPAKNDKAVMDQIRVSMQSATNAGDSVDVNDIPNSSYGTENATVDGNTIDLPSYNQDEIAISNTTASITVGDLTNEQLKDFNNETNADVVAQVTRDLKLRVSANATVTWLNPYDGDKTARQLDNVGGIVTMTNIDLRNYYGKAMQILVDAEDGSTYQTYNLRFNGRPSGTPAVSEVVLGGCQSYIADNDGNMVIHVPYSLHNNTVEDADDLACILTSVSATATAGATVIAGDISVNMKNTDVTENHKGTIIDRLVASASGNYRSSTTTDAHMFSANIAPSSPYAKADFFMQLHASYEHSRPEDSNEGCNYWENKGDNKITKRESAANVYIYLDGPNDKANINELTLTTSNTMLGASTSKYPAEIDHDNKRITVNVPFSFAKTENDTHDVDTKLYVYDWAKDEPTTVHAVAGGDHRVAGFNKATFAEQLDEQETDTTLIANLTTDSAIISEAKKDSFDWKKNGIPVYVYAQDVVSGIPSVSAANPAQVNPREHATEYKLRLVRQNAERDATLNGVTASAPVSVVLDETVAKLNRYKILVPANYNSDDGVENAKPFTLTFDTASKKATVKNVQNTWATPESGYTVEFKVANDKLYYQNHEVTKTDGRVMHFTVWAEDGRTSREYEFIIGEGEASSDATLASVKIDDKVSFDKNDKAFSVKDLSEDMNYDVKKLPIYFEVTTPGATVTVDGTEYKNDTVTGTNIIVDLSEGKTVTAVVTAADGTTTETYTLSMRQGPDPVEKPSSKYTDLDKAYSGLRGKVESAIDMGIMGSTSKTALVFGPKNNITRKDVAVIIARADLIASDEKVTNADEADTALKAMYTDGKDAFTDLGKCNDVQKAAIRYCAEKEIVSGTGNGFAPDGALTREQMAVILTNWTKTTVPSGTANINNIADWNSVSNWAKPYVNAVYGKMMNGVGNNKFGPKGIVNREQTASVLVDAFGIIYPEFGK